MTISQIFIAMIKLKDDPHLFTGGKCTFFFHSKCKISGLECLMRFKLVLAHTLDPSGPFWIAHPTKKYLHPKAQPEGISVEKKCIFWDQLVPLLPFWSKNFLDPKFGPRPSNTFEWRQKSICSILIHLKLTIWQKK